jgi:hypothetical protein
VKNFLFFFALVTGFSVFTVPHLGIAQPAPKDQNGSLPAYQPGLGDLMTMTVQPRHIKLALAGHEQNWAYAAYELHELDEAFGRAARAWPQWQSLPITDMLRSVMKEPMANLAQAIKAADAARFATAYGQLTDGCNACHQAANRGFVAIQPPQASPIRIRISNVRNSARHPRRIRAKGFVRPPDPGSAMRSRTAVCFAIH